jgi:hypothetical protein
MPLSFPLHFVSFSFTPLPHVGTVQQLLIKTSPATWSKNSTKNTIRRSQVQCSWAARKREDENESGEKSELCLQEWNVVCLCGQFFVQHQFNFVLFITEEKFSYFFPAASVVEEFCVCENKDSNVPRFLFIHFSVECRCVIAGELGRIGFMPSVDAISNYSRQSAVRVIFRSTW